MRKNSRNAKSLAVSTNNRGKDRLTIGIDLGDKTSRYCVLNAAGEIVEEGSCEP